MQRYQRYSGVAAPDSVSGAALKSATALANNNQARFMRIRRRSRCAKLK